MKRLIATYLILSIALFSNQVEAQVSIEFSTSYAPINEVQFTKNVIAGEYETRVYNPLNIGMKNQWGPWKVGMDLSWIVYINNFNGIELDRFSNVEGSDFLLYMNGGYDRSQLVSMVNCSYSFFKERFLSVGIGLGVAHNFSNHIRDMTFRDIYQGDDFTLIETYEIDGVKGYSNSTAYQVVARLSSPQSWPFLLFLEANLYGYSPIWRASRLSFPEQSSRFIEDPLSFSHQTLFLRFGFGFPLAYSSDAKSEADKGPK